MNLTGVYVSKSKRAGDNGDRKADYFKVTFLVNWEGDGRKIIDWLTSDYLRLLLERIKG